MLCSSSFVDDDVFSHDRAYVVYGEAYGKGCQSAADNQRGAELKC